MSESPAVAPQDASSVTTAPVNFVELLTENGTLVLIPRVVYDRLKDQDEIVLKVPLSRHYTEKEGWLTVGEAATKHMQDVDGLSLETARVRISRAATKGRFKAEGVGKERRIDPISFDAWRLEQRERSLDSLDDDE